MLTPDSNSLYFQGLLLKTFWMTFSKTNVKAAYIGQMIISLIIVI